MINEVQTAIKDRLNLLLVFMLVPVLTGACSSGDNPAGPGEEEPPEEEVALQMVDPDATELTKALYSRLWTTQQEGVMFGHHDDLIYGRNWMTEPGRSDIKDVVGDYPAVFSVDFAPLMDNRKGSDELNDDRRRTILEARARGEVIIANAHLNNPLTGGDSWDNSSSEVVKEILSDGSETNIKYKGWLDNMAAFVSNLKDGNGKLVPIIFRPYHEHNHTWSWWGKSCTSRDEFISFWRFTVDYLRDQKGVHNLIYAISPQLDSKGSESSLLERWPGDDYVDFIGMDSYHGTNTEALKTNLKNLEALSKEKMKPAGVTETGIEGIRDYDGTPLDNYWTRQILTPFVGRELSMVVMWRNKYDPGGHGHHYYAPFEGHSSAPDFRDFYNSSITLFSSDLPDMYRPADGVRVE